MTEQDHLYLKRCERSSPCCIMIRKKSYADCWVGSRDLSYRLVAKNRKMHESCFSLLAKIQSAALCRSPIWIWSIFTWLMLAWSAWGIFRRRFEVGTGVLSVLSGTPQLHVSCSRCSLSCLQPPVSFQISATSIWRQNARNPSTRTLITLVCLLVSHALSSQLS